MYDTDRLLFLHLMELCEIIEFFRVFQTLPNLDQFNVLLQPLGCIYRIVYNQDRQILTPVLWAFHIFGCLIEVEFLL